MTLVAIDLNITPSSFNALTSSLFPVICLKILPPQTKGLSLILSLPEKTTTPNPNFLFRHLKQYDTLYPVSCQFPILDLFYLWQQFSHTDVRPFMSKTAAPATRSTRAVLRMTQSELLLSASYHSDNRIHR